MSNDKFLDTLAFDEFDTLVQSYVDRTEPDMIDFDIFQELAAESNQPPVEIVLTGIIENGQLKLDIPQSANIPLRVEGNQIEIQNLRLVIQLPSVSALRDLTD